MVLWPTYTVNNTVRNQTKLSQDTVEFQRVGSQVHGNQTWQSWPLHKKFIYLAVFSNVSGSKLSDVENAAVKIRGGVGEISDNCWSFFTYDQTTGIHLMAIRCVAAKYGVLFEKEGWVKLKAFWLTTWAAYW